MLPALFIILMVLLMFLILRLLILISTNILYLSKDDDLTNTNDDIGWL